MFTSMKKRKFIGLMTILGGIPGFGALITIAVGNTSSSYITFLVMTELLFRGVCGTIGGILLWQGKRIGYIFSLTCWSYMAIVASYTIFSGDLFKNLEFSSDNKFFWSTLGKIAGKISWGIPFIFILTRDLIRTRETEKTGAFNPIS